MNNNLKLNTFLVSAIINLILLSNFIACKGGKKINYSKITIENEPDNQLNNSISNHNETTKIINTDLTCEDLLAHSTENNPEENTEKEVQRYHKCFQQFTMNRVKINDTRLVKIKNGELSGTEACIELLNSASLSGDEDSSSWPMIESNSTEGKKVLKVFHDLHRTWFSNIQYPALNSHFLTYDLLEDGEAALFYTRSLFSDEIGFDAVLKGNSVLGGMRATDFEQRNTDHTGHLAYYIDSVIHKKSERDAKNLTGYSFARDIFNSKGFVLDFLQTNEWKAYEEGVDHPSRDFITASAPIVETGELIGIKSRSHQYQNTELRNYCGVISNVNAKGPKINGFGGIDMAFTYKSILDNNGNADLNGSLKNSALYEPGRGFNVKIGLTSPIDLFKSAGGGALGSHAFILQNMDDNFPKLYAGEDLYDNPQNGTRVVADGSVKIQRRWAKRALSDFLCREVPVINYSDLDSDEVEYVDVNSSIPFRRKIMCMGCHATMDQMAMSARNIILEQTGGVNIRNISKPTLGPDELCVPTKTGKAMYFQNGAWEEVDYPNHKLKYEIYDAPAGSYYESLCVHQPHQVAKGKTSFWPNSQDTYAQEIKCQKNTIAQLEPINFVNESESLWHEEPLEGYYKTKPLGKFLFREWDKKVEDPPININIEGIEELAAEMRNTSDFYACGAKRYLEFLTGIKTYMAHANPFRSTTLNPTELNHQKLLSCLGNLMKKNNDPKQLIAKIIDADIYLDSNIFDVPVLDSVESKVNQFEAVYSILNEKGCIGCHGGMNWEENDFIKKNWPENSRSVSVIPGKPCESPLFLSLNLTNGDDYNPCGSTTGGGSMPKRNNPLNKSDLKIIYNWIREK